MAHSRSILPLVDGFDGQRKLAHLLESTLRIPMSLFWTTIEVHAALDGGASGESFLHLLIAAPDLSAAQELALSDKGRLASMLVLDRARVVITGASVLRTVEIPDLAESTFLVGFADPTGVLASDALDPSNLERPARP
jgi:hypothetical protein